MIEPVVAAVLCSSASVVLEMPNEVISLVMLPYVVDVDVEVEDVIVEVSKNIKPQHFYERMSDNDLKQIYNHVYKICRGCLSEIH